MRALEQAMEKSRTMANAVYEHTKHAMEKGGFSSNDLASGIVESLNSGSNFSKNKKSYALFSGWLYSAINAIATHAAGQPVHLGKILGTSEDAKNKLSCVKQHQRNLMSEHCATKSIEHEVELIVDDVVLDTINQPNPLQHRWQFVYSFVANLLLTGRAYIIRNVEKDGKVEYYSLPTTWIRAEHSGGAFNKFFIVDPNSPSKEVELDKEMVRFAQLPDPSNPRKALPPTSAQINAVQIDEHIQSSQNVFFENGVFPSATIIVGKTPHPDVTGGLRPRLTAPQRRQINAAVTSVMRGNKNYGNPIILDGLIEDVKRFSATQTEMGWEKSEDKVRERILSSTCVPAYILGAKPPQSYAAANITLKIYYDRVNTYLNMLSTVMSDFINASEENEHLLVWWEKCVAVDEQLRSRNLNNARKNGDVTPNEVRADLGLAPDADPQLFDTKTFNAIRQWLIDVTKKSISRESAVESIRGLGLTLEQAEKIVGPPMEDNTTEQAVEVLEDAINSLNPNLITSKILKDVECSHS